MTRDEHLAWAKSRALEYLDRNDLSNAYTSMTSDLSKHPNFQKSTHAAIIQLGLFHVMNRDKRELRRWIEGFN